MRGTSADGLSDVIQSLQLIHKSGLLTAERDVPGNSSEVGRIMFHHGQVVDAEVGRLRGPEALRNLLAWGHCCFIFEPASPTPPQASSPLPVVRQNSQMMERNYKEARSNSNTIPIPTPTFIVPYRSRYVEGTIPDFQHFGLSRLHRQLFLLIDGKRTTQELARLIGRHPQEISALLIDLERTGLIGH